MVHSPVRSSFTSESWTRFWTAALLAASAFVFGGCEVDSFLDPSRVGRWEHTPTSVPILRRIASIEGPEDEFLEVTGVTGADLIPEILEYQIGPGDTVLVTIWNFPIVDQENQFERLIDARGMIDLPQIGEVPVAGLSVRGAKTAIAQTMRDRQLVADPVVDLILGSQRELRFSVIGAVGQPGPYFIPEADFRLLEALTAAGGASEASEWIYVIRQIPLAESVSGRPPGQPPPGEQPPKSGEDLINIIDRLSEPPPAPPPSEKPPGSPGVFRPQPGSQPPVDLPEGPAPTQPSQPPPGGAEDAAWMFLNGRWVQVSRSAFGGVPESPLQEGPTREQLVTQRVIRIPTLPLFAGDARYNLVIRPGDVVRVPPPPGGVVYIGGEINRPGAFDLAEGMTLMRLVSAAGGLGAIAIPERVDIVRMVGDGRQAIVRVNLRAIFSGTQPDLYVRANDMINIGTNFWAYPLAVLRNGVRASYGYGFVVDRNFGNDVFGAPPANQFGQ